MPEDRLIHPKYRVFREPRDVPIDQHPVDLEALRFWTYPPGKYPHIVTLKEVDDFFFVLRPTKDHHARVALAAYIASCSKEFPGLAEDLSQAAEFVQIEE